jgi:hypothetical protein
MLAISEKRENVRTKERQVAGTTVFLNDSFTPATQNTRYDGNPDVSFI